MILVILWIEESEVERNYVTCQSWAVNIDLLALCKIQLLMYCVFLYVCRKRYIVEGTYGYETFIYLSYP